MQLQEGCKLINDIKGTEKHKNLWVKREEVAEDLVGACAFLVSDAANFMTGQIMVIDGGATFH